MRGTYDQLEESMSILLQPNETELRRSPSYSRSAEQVNQNYNKELRLI